MALITAATITIGVGVGLSSYAHGLGERALNGLEVKEIRFVGLPLLDIHADYVVVQWVGAAAQRPQLLVRETPMCSLYVGQNATDVFFLPATPWQQKLAESSHVSVEPALMCLPVRFVATKVITEEQCLKLR